jgi:transposase-like protein
MHASHTPLSVWFWGAYLVTTQTPGQSALQFQRQLGLSRYETALQILHKLRAAMVRPARDAIGGQYAVEVDETLVGGRTRGEGRGVHHKATVVGAVEARPRRAAARARKPPGRSSSKRLRYAGRLRLRLVSGRDGDALRAFVQENVAKGSVVRTDDWQGYDGIAGLGYQHEPVVLGGDPAKAEAHLPTIHLVFSNLKTWLLGTHHGVSQQHLPAYLNEYVFRFNRRFYPMTAFNSVLGLAAHAVSPTYEALYQGQWVHPAS